MFTTIFYETDVSRGLSIFHFFFSWYSLGHVVPLNVRSYVSTTTCLMWLSICSSFYNTLEDTSWNKSSFIRVDGNRVRLVYHFLLRFLTVLHMKSFQFSILSNHFLSTGTQLFHLLIFLKMPKRKEGSSTLPEFCQNCLTQSVVACVWQLLNYQTIPPQLTVISSYFFLTNLSNIFGISW